MLQLQLQQSEFELPLPRFFVVAVVVLAENLARLGEGQDEGIADGAMGVRCESIVVAVQQGHVRRVEGWLLRVIITLPVVFPAAHRSPRPQRQEHTLGRRHGRRGRELRGRSDELAKGGSEEHPHVAPLELYGLLLVLDSWINSYYRVHEYAHRC